MAVIMHKDSLMALFSRPRLPLSADRRDALAEDERALEAARAVLAEFEMPDPIDALEMLLLEMEEADDPETRSAAERIAGRRGNVIEVDFETDAL